MIIGTQIVVFGSGEHEYLTPWFPSMADNAYVTYEEIRKYFGTDGSYSVHIWTKNREDVGSKGTEYSTTFTQIGSTGFYEKEVTGLKDLMRFKIKLTGGSSPATAEGVAIRFVPVTWYSEAK